MAAHAFGSGHSLVRVGVVGCGSVGCAICRVLDERQFDAELHAINDIKAGKVDALMWSLTHRPQSMTLPGVVATCDLVVEATNPEAAPDVIRQALEAGRDILIANPAGLVGREDFSWMAAERGASIRLPCDILAGLDGVRAAAGGGLESAVLTVTGPPAFLARQPAGRQSQDDLAGPAEPTQVFRGTGADALAALPELANAIAVMGYAAGGLGAITVVAVADGSAPGLRCRVEAASGDASVAAESHIALPREGPRASPMVALSAVAALRRAVESLVIG